MAVTQLASSADVVSLLGRDLTAAEADRVDAILDKASELFRMHAGRQFTAGTSSVWLSVRNGVVTLPERPVVSVESVVDTEAADVDYTLRAGRLHVSHGLNHSQVLVDYTHGGDVPDLVRLTVADVTRKVLSIGAAAVAGVTQRSDTTGPFTVSQSYATWAQGGDANLSPEDKAIARSFRPLGVGTIYV